MGIPFLLPSRHSRHSRHSPSFSLFSVFFFCSPSHSHSRLFVLVLLSPRFLIHSSRRIHILIGSDTHASLLFSSSLLVSSRLVVAPLVLCAPPDLCDTRRSARSLAHSRGRHPLTQRGFLPPYALFLSYNVLCTNALGSFPFKAACTQCLSVCASFVSGEQ